jgi:flagellar L-ring protein FlgH
VRPLLLVPALLLAALLSGCASREQMNALGKEPALTPVGSGYERVGDAAYSYPREPAQPTRKFSLWDDRQSRLFTDPRALSTGDILTVKISLDDRARFKNESERERTASRSLGVGLDLSWEWIKGINGNADVDLDSDTKSKGAGSIARSEQLDLSIAAVVTEVLPNGNLLIRGSQEVRVNAELRVLTIAGIVRVQDIGADNTIPYERIAEARISYGGRGRISEVQQPPLGQQVIDAASPL